MFKKMWVLALIVALALSLSVPVFAQEPLQTQEVQELTVEDVLKVLPVSSMDLSSPNAVLSRGDFAAMLAYAAGIPSSKVSDVSKLPSDLKADAWYAGPVMALHERNILKGYSDKKIYPENKITGIEAMALVARTLGIPESAPAPDTSVEGINEDHWGFALYSWLEKEGLALENVDIAKPVHPDSAAKLLVNIFGTDKEAKAIVDESNAKSKDLKSMRIKGTMSLKMNMESTDGTPIPISTEATFNSEFSKDMVIHQTIETVLPDEKNPGATQKVNIEEYMDKDYIYMLVPDKNGTEKWTKVKNPVSVVFDKDFISQQQEMLKGFDGLVHYRLLGKETMDGKQVYKLAVYSRIDDMSKLMSMLGSSMGDQEKQALGTVNNLLKSIYIRGIIYMGVDDSLVYNADLDANILMNTDEQTESPVVINSMDIEMNYNYYDYNADINIKIPEEAQKAQEIDLKNPPSDNNSQ